MRLHKQHGVGAGIPPYVRALWGSLSHRWRGGGLGVRVGGGGGDWTQATDHYPGTKSDQRGQFTPTQDRWVKLPSGLHGNKNHLTE